MLIEMHFKSLGGFFAFLLLEINIHKASFCILKTEMDSEKCHVSFKGFQCWLVAKFVLKALNRHNAITTYLTCLSCCSVLEQEAEPFSGLHCSHPGLECLPNALKRNCSDNIHYGVSVYLVSIFSDAFEESCSSDALC